MCYLFGFMFLTSKRFGLRACDFVVLEMVMNLLHSLAINGLFLVRSGLSNLINMM